MPKKLPGISRSEALKRLRKAGLEFKSIESSRHSRHDYDSGELEAEVALARPHATRSGGTRDRALVARHKATKSQEALGQRLLERYPKAAIKRARKEGSFTGSYTRLKDAVGKSGSSLGRAVRLGYTKKFKKIFPGHLGLGLTAASLGSSIREARKK